ncbi:MAG: hypothetical protein RML45_12385 [Acetobacteraceae bacterium]|nr:hypothetical protein [Acetobacteraceae bacterium]
MVQEHDLFLDALAKGKVITTAFLRELGDDDEAFEDLLETSGEARDSANYDVARLRAAVERDRDILRDLVRAASCGERRGRSQARGGGRGVGEDCGGSAP